MSSLDFSLPHDLATDAERYWVLHNYSFIKYLPNIIQKKFQGNVEIYYTKYYGVGGRGGDRKWKGRKFQQQKTGKIH